MTGPGAVCHLQRPPLSIARTRAHARASGQGQGTPPPSSWTPALGARLANVCRLRLEVDLAGHVCNPFGADRSPVGGSATGGRLRRSHAISLVPCYRNCGASRWLQRVCFGQQRERQGDPRQRFRELPTLRRVERRHDERVQHGETLAERADDRGRSEQRRSGRCRLERLLRCDRERRYMGGLLPFDRRWLQLAGQPGAGLSGRLLGGGPRLSGARQLRGAGDPSQAFDREGRLFYAFICFNRSKPINGSVFVARYTNDGGTYDRTVLVKSGTPSGQFLTGLFQDKINLTTDQTTSPFSGNVYVAWSQYNGFAPTNAVLFSRSTDNGLTYSRPIRVTPVSHGTASFADLAVGPDGAVYLTFLTYASSSNPSTDVWLSTSTDGGASFGSPAHVATIAIFDSSEFSGNGATDCGDGPFACPSGLTSPASRARLRSPPMRPGFTWSGTGSYQAVNRRSLFATRPTGSPGRLRRPRSTRCRSDTSGRPTSRRPAG